MIRSIAKQLPGETATLDAQVLLEHITGQPRSWLLSHPEATLTETQVAEITLAIARLQAGLPLPYLLGRWSFFGLDFLVTPAVLIPRPETELLVETALAHIKARPQLAYKILDIGTGSGIIPISLATYIPDAQLTATDISSAALKVAQTNAIQHGVENRIDFLEADLIPKNFDLSKFDIITANLPYIPTETLHQLEIFGKEPTLALDGGPDGLTYIRRLILEIKRYSSPPGLILLEIEQVQGQSVKNFVQQTFPNFLVQIKKDLAGYDRLITVNT